MVFKNCLIFIFVFWGTLLFGCLYTCIDLLTDSQEMYTSFDVVNFDVLEF